MVKLKKKIIISFMGVDGSGKTTLAKNLQKVIKNSQYLHLKPYILFQDRRRVVKKPQQEKKSLFILSFLSVLSWLISYRFFFFQNTSKKIYIFDRYAHDLLIDPLRYRHGLPIKFTKFFLQFFPQPDLWIFLKPSLRIIKSRKIELHDSEINRQIQEYIKFFKHKKNVIMLNTNMQKKKIITKILTKINTVVK